MNHGELHLTLTISINDSKTVSSPHLQGNPMKSFVVLFTCLVLTVPVIGCGSGASTSGTGTNSDDPSQWGEAKKYQVEAAKKEAERIAKTKKAP
jgi:hypothetical protein